MDSAPPADASRRALLAPEISQTHLRTARRLVSRWMGAKLPRSALVATANISPLRVGDLRAIEETVLRYRKRIAEVRPGKTGGVAADEPDFGRDLYAFAEGDFTPCLRAGRSGTPPGGRRAELSEALRLAGEPWAPDGETQDGRLPEGRLLVVVLDHADWRAILPFVGSGNSGVIVRFADGPPEDAPLPQGFALETRKRNRRGGDLVSFEDVRSLARDVAAALPDTLGRGPVADWMIRYAVALENRLFVDIADPVMLAQQVADCVHDHRPQGAVIVEGNRIAGFLTSVLRQEGIEPPRIRTLSGSCKITSRLEFAARYRGFRLDGLRSENSSPDLAAEPGTLLAAAIERFRTLIRKPKFVSGRPLLTFEAKSMTDFRYLPTALALLDRLATRGPVDIVHQRIVWRRAVFGVLRDLHRRFRGRIRIFFVPPPNGFSYDRAAPMWSAHLVERVAPLVASRGWPSKALQEVALAGIYAFAGRFLAQSLALAVELEDAFRKSPPAYLAAVPGLKTFTMMVSAAARAAGVPTLDVQTLLIGRTGRDVRPVCEYLACIDTFQRDLYAERFGFDPDKVTLIGQLDTAQWRERAAAFPSGEAASERRKRIVYAAQPLSDLSPRALKYLVEATRARNDVELTVYPHPDEQREMIEAYEEILASSGREEKYRLSRDRITAEVVATADLVTTINSNVGYRAGILGRDVLAIDLFGENSSINLGELGIAATARTQLEVTQVLNGLLDGGPERATLEASRQVFLSRNPQLVAGNPVDVLAKRLDELGARG